MANNDPIIENIKLKIKISINISYTIPIKFIVLRL